MKAIIEYSKITHTYYLWIGLQQVSSTRKDEIERVAKKAGATEIEHKNRSTVKDLQRMGFTKESALRLSKEFYS